MSNIPSTSSSIVEIGTSGGTNDRYELRVNKRSKLPIQKMFLEDNKNGQKTAVSKCLKYDVPINCTNGGTIGLKVYDVSCTGSKR